MKFSIVVATYNRAEALKRCIESILVQSHKDFELLVVDDGSTDSTPTMVKEIVDARIRYIQLDRNYGTATPARNRGIEEMTGDALIIWDSDDVLLPNALETLVHGFDIFKVDIVCTSTHFYYGSDIVEYARRPTGLLTTLDWVRGDRPRDAEIIAIKKELIGASRFRSRGIDFMFYIEILGNNNPEIAYVNETCGKVMLESDDLSLTKQRKKMNVQLSRERGEILDLFLSNYKQVFFEAGAYKKYAGYAYGAAVGLLLDGQRWKSIKRAWHAFYYLKTFHRLSFFIFTLLPFAPYMLAKLATIKNKYK